MTNDRDDLYGTVSRRTLAYTERFDGEPPTTRPTAPPYSEASFVTPEAAHAFGPEAAERAQMMAYERTKKIQQESPYAAQEVVEHVVHDHRLYIGMWIVAGVAGVSAYLTFSLACLIITLVALLFALTSSPGRQYKS